MRASFILSAPDVSGLPDHGIGEVAFVGRSNVGKSSLLNRLAGAKIARISKTPGRTRLINLFEVDAGEHRFMLVDLPGYGYAKLPRTLRAELRQMMEKYLRTRRPLRGVLFLIDIRREVSEEDRAMLRAIIDARGRESLLVVATKLDKLSKAQKKPAVERIAREIAVPVATVSAVSAETGEGIEDLRARVSERAGD